MAPRSSSSKLLLIGAIASLGTSCAHRAAEPPRAWPGAEQDPRLSALEARLQAGEDRLYSVLGSPSVEQQGPPSSPAPAAAPAAPAAAPAPPAGAAPAEAPTPASEDFDDRAFNSQRSEALPEQEQTRARSACDEACDAFRSMERSARQICQLTGDGAPRCARARDRIAVARKQLSAAGCGCATE